MDITGSIRSVLPEQTGSGKNGIWKKQNIIIQTEGQYPKDVCITVWGDKVDKDLLKAGVSVRVHFDLESREFNGKWYTDVRGWKLEPEHIEEVSASLPSESADYSESNPHNEDESLPF